MFVPFVMDYGKKHIRTELYVVREPHEVRLVLLNRNALWRQLQFTELDTLTMLIQAFQANQSFKLSTDDLVRTCSIIQIC